METYITPELLILAPVLYGLGMVLRDTAVPNKLIPATLTGVSIIITGLYIFSARACTTTQDIAQAIFMTLTQGVLIASVAVYGNEVIKHSKHTEEGDA